MNDYICLLLSLWNGESLMKVALRVKPDTLSPDAQSGYYMEPEVRRELQALLPPHCQAKELVEVVVIFEIWEISKP